MKFLILFLSISMKIKFLNSFGEFIPIMEEDFESCTSDKKYHRADLTNFKLITGKDRVYANGTVKFLKDIKSPWKVNFTTERMMNGVWQKGDVKRVMDDFCISKKNPSEPSYIVSKYIKDCPIKAGDIQEFKMVPTSVLPAYLPSDYRGEWRFYARSTYSDSKDGQVEDCSVISLEVMQK
uniref:CSON003010 protein n=1 Tax=Culicoides sonorensis TaxID=179676 RepID=A0A336LST0_CULSO